MNGQMLSGHFLNKVESMLGYRRVAANMCIPLVFPVLASQGFKLDRMILNAVRFILFGRHDVTSDFLTKNQFAIYQPDLCGVLNRKMMGLRKTISKYTIMDPKVDKTKATRLMSDEEISREAQRDALLKKSSRKFMFADDKISKEKDHS